MSEFSNKNLQQNLPQTPAASLGTTPISPNALKLSLTVALPPVKENSKQSVQIKTKQPSGADPEQIANANVDAEFINTVTHLVKAATVHPLGSRRENRELHQIRNSLDQAKEAKAKAVDQATKNQTLQEQEKTQQRSAGEKAKNRDGAAKNDRTAIGGERGERRDGLDRDSASRESRDQPPQFRDRQIADRQTELELAKDAALQRATQSTGLAERNSSREGIKESLTNDLIRDRASDNDRKSAAEKTSLSDSLREQRVEGQKVDAQRFEQSKLYEPLNARVVESLMATDVARGMLEQQRLREELRLYQETNVGASENGVEVEEDELTESWAKRGKKIRKTDKQKKRDKRKLTPLERRKKLLRKDKLKTMRSRRKRRTNLLLFR